jgi:hypothetical protein
MALYLENEFFSALAGLVAFFDERVDVTVDGERRERPADPLVAGRLSGGYRRLSRPPSSLSRAATRRAMTLAVGASARSVSSSGTPPTWAKVKST